MTSTFLYPGQLKVGRSADILRTILGSCVAVVFWDPTTKIGGMCHYLLADAPSGAVPSGRYGSFAIEMLLREMLDSGANRSKITASIYGGGAVVDALSSGSGGIGERNIQLAENAVRLLDLPVRERNVGGLSGRRIALDVSTGEVLCESQKSGDKSNRSGLTLAETKKLVKVLIVDDSATLRTILKSVFERTKKVEVVGTATDPFDARDKIIQLKPDVITLDIEMPRMNGIQFLEKLMAHQPMPVVVVSSLSAEGTAAERALELGAIEFVHKPSQFDPGVLSDLAELLIPKVIGAASVDVKSFQKSNKASSQPYTVRSAPKASPADRGGSGISGGIQLIGVCGNGGSSDALAHLLSSIAADSPPVVVAIPTIAGFAQAWIQKHRLQFSIPIEVAQVDRPLQSGHVYLWGDDQHVKVTRIGGVYKLERLKSPPVSGQRPSADILFDSIAETAGSRGIGVLLSGYGKDGVHGLGRLRDVGGWTICQTPQDCSFNFNVVAALEAGVVSEVADRQNLSQSIYQRRSAIITG